MKFRNSLIFIRRFIPVTSLVCIVIESFFARVGNRHIMPAQQSRWCAIHVSLSNIEHTARQNAQCIVHHMQYSKLKPSQVVSHSICSRYLARADTPPFTNTPILYHYGLILIWIYALLSIINNLYTHMTHRRAQFYLLLLHFSNHLIYEYITWYFEMVQMVSTLFPSIIVLWRSERKKKLFHS